VRWSKGSSVNRVRVTPELIQVSNASTRWSQPFDTVMSDVFAVQASIAGQVAQALNAHESALRSDRRRAWTRTMSSSKARRLRRALA
jgi:hypothetical protein